MPVKPVWMNGDDPEQREGRHLQHNGLEDERPLTVAARRRSLPQEVQVSAAASRLLLERESLLAALGMRARLEPTRDGRPGTVGAIGNVISAAAIDSAYQSYSGRILVDDESSPIVIGQLALLFADAAVAAKTFAQVAEAAHLRTSMGGASVAVETVTASNGLVSYWAFLQLAAAIVILTLDTVNPNDVSMSDFRSIVTVATSHLEHALT